MSDVHVVEPGHAARFIGRAHILLVPLRHHVHSVGIGINQDENGVVTDEPCSRVLVRQQVIGELQVVLRRRHFGGVKTAVDVNDRLAFGRQLASTLVRQSLGAGELFRDVLVVVELLEVFLRGNDGVHHRFPHGGFSHLEEPEPG